ncbi:hypothetical protein L596_023373 [Steinernema carpocapsae]|nr:hypothetical protein L596_023373 [Steinernema carpocapsae]
MQESQIAALHNAECDFYLNFAKHVDIPLPKVFEIQKTLVEKNQRGVLLMESLVGKCDQCPLQGDATEEQVYEVAKQIAKYQSYILSLPTDQWLGKHKKDEILKTFTKADFFGPFFQRVKQLKPGEFDHGIEVLSKYSNQFNFAWYTSVGVGQDIGQIDCNALLTFGLRSPDDALSRRFLQPKSALENESRRIAFQQVGGHYRLASDA